jgi:hypothetical protein
MGIHLLRCVHGNECTQTHDPICDTLVSIVRDVSFHVGWEKFTCASFNHIQFLSLTSWHCVYQKWHSHLNQHYHCQPNIGIFTSMFLCNSRMCQLRCSSNQGKELSQLTPHWSILPLSNWSIWLLTQTCWCVFTRLCQCHLELKRAIGPSSFYLGHFSLSNFFDHITKDANVLHLNLGDNRKLNHFLTSSPSKHTSHHHGRIIASRQFLTYKYGQPTSSDWLQTWRDFHNYFEPI